MSNRKQREAEDERLAAQRAENIVGMDLDKPLCEYCGKDWHVKPDCPVAKSQQKFYEEVKRRWRER